MKFLFSSITFLLTVFSVYAQSNSLYDISQVGSIYINIPADTLTDLYADPYSYRYREASLVFDDGVHQDTVPQIGIRFRGNTSRNAAKKSFKISFNEFVSGRSYQGVKKLNLNAAHNDPTMMREIVFYEIWNQANMPARRVSFVKLYLNGVYVGLYNNLEEFDKNWLQRVFGENNGNLYKCTYPADLKYLGTNQQTYKNLTNGTGRVYELQTNETLDDYTDLVQLITALNQTPNAAFETQIQQLLDVNGFLKALAIDVATGNWDDYAYNRNNYFLYHSPASGKFTFITYDADNTLGIDWVGIDWATRDVNTWIHPTQTRPLATKLLAIPAFRTKYEAALDSIVTFITEPDSIFPRLDELQTLIAPAAVTDTFAALDWGFTTADFYNGMTQTVIAHCPYGIKPFLETRKNTAVLQLSIENITPSEVFEISAYPNPVADILTLKAEHKQKLTVGVYDTKGTLLQTTVWNEDSPMISLFLNDYGHQLLTVSIADDFGIKKTILVQH